MKLLVFTQALDYNDPVLGFFHRWIIELSKHYERVTVVCLYLGAHELPSNVEIYSLGKEVNTSRAGRVRRFFSYIRRFKNDYDAVFVHMNQEYVLLGGWLWRRWGKKVYLWRNHWAGNRLTDIAAGFCTKVFCTSKYSYTARYPKSVIMPVGVDTDAFDRMPEIPRDPRAILFLGRIAPAKKPDLLLRALTLLKAQGVTFSASFYGPVLLRDEPYKRSLEESAAGLDDAAHFYPGVRNSATPQIYNRHSIFVNCSGSGMLDKTIFEAMACECLVLVSSADFAALVEPQLTFEQGSAESLAQKLQALLELSVNERQAQGARLRNIAKNHSLEKLIDCLAQELG